MENEYLIQHSIEEGFDWMIVNEYETPLLHCNAPIDTIRKLVDLANVATEQRDLTEALKDIRATAHTGLPAMGMTEEQWAKHRLNVIARDLTRLLEQIEQAR